MATKIYQPWVPLERIESMVQIEPAILTLGLALSVWIISRVFFRRLSPDRALNLKSLLRNLFFHSVLSMLFFILFHSFNQLLESSVKMDRVQTYIGLAAVFSGATIVVKSCRILVFEYFFISYKNSAFPVLIVHLISLLVSMVLATWLGAEIFNIQLAPLLATSAVFSLVLGLALQDTLGNLFAGVALQFDKPYGIGDWVEVHHEGHPLIGQVFEISWRATVLVPTTREHITVPNRSMAQAKISNFSVRNESIIRHLIFTLEFGANVAEVKEILLTSIRQVQAVRTTPSPEAWVDHLSESGISFRLRYAIDDFGMQMRIGDQIYSLCLAGLEKAGYRTAIHQVALKQDLHS